MFFRKFLPSLKVVSSSDLSSMDDLQLCTALEGLEISPGHQAQPELFPTSLRELTVHDSVSFQSISHLSHLTFLVAKTVDESGFCKLPNLRLLQIINGGDEADIEPLTSWTNLTSLQIYSNCHLPEGISKMTNLRELWLDEHHPNVELVRSLTNLTSLAVGQFPLRAVSNFQLQKLVVDAKTDYDCLTEITSLTDLRCCGAPMPDLTALTNLTCLKYPGEVTEDSLPASLKHLVLDDLSFDVQTIAHLTSLEHLYILDCPDLSSAGVSKMTNLTKLKIVGPTQITEKDIRCLTNLNHLSVPYITISDTCVAGLSKLTRLNRYGARYVTPNKFDIAEKIYWPLDDSVDEEDNNNNHNNNNVNAENDNDDTDIIVIN